jgi:hypothetical protein
LVLRQQRQADGVRRQRHGLHHHVSGELPDRTRGGSVWPCHEALELFRGQGRAGDAERVRRQLDDLDRAAG